jgi:hypothetical protein
MAIRELDTVHGTKHSWKKSRWWKFGLGEGCPPFFSSDSTGGSSDASGDVINEAIPRKTPYQVTDADRLHPKKIRATVILSDLRAGMTDEQLAAQYDISLKTLQDLFEKIIDAGLESQDYFSKRAAKQAAVPKTKTCPYCGFTSRDPFTRCPRCNQDAAEWLDTVELTRILTSAID